MFSIIRTIIFIIAGLIVFIIAIRKTRKAKILIFIISFILAELIWLFPIENIFLRFNTIEESFNYSFGRETQILKSYINDNNALVFYGEENGITYSLYNRHKKGWEIISPNYRLGHKNYKVENRIYLTKEKAVGNKYLVIVTELSFKGYKEIIDAISDSTNSNFNLYKFESPVITNYYYYTFVDWPKSGYDLLINGKTYHID